MRKERYNQFKPEGREYREGLYPSAILHLHSSHNPGNTPVWKREIDMQIGKTVRPQTKLCFWDLSAECVHKLQRELSHAAWRHVSVSLSRAVENYHPLCPQLLTPCSTISNLIFLSLPAFFFHLASSFIYHVSFLRRPDPGPCQLLIEAINYLTKRNRVRAKVSPSTPATDSTLRLPCE